MSGLRLDDHRARFQRLDAVLTASAGLWRPSPYRERRPVWCASEPALTQWLLALDDATVESLAGNESGLHAALAAYLPVIAELASHTRLEARATVATAPLPAHFDWDIPGRKLGQIAAFADAVGEPSAPMVEWCAGKGHLGRLMAARGAREVRSVEREVHLCEQGRRLAQRARTPAQRFASLDALDGASEALLHGRHVIALHACGHLHRRLISGARGLGFTALDLSPCCYHLGAEPVYTPLCGLGGLRPTRDELRLAVTESVTAPARVRDGSQRARAWKLGFQHLRALADGVGQARPMRPVPPAWLRESFETFCRMLAAREGCALPAVIDWAGAAAAGERRCREVDRLSLPRMAFRRSLELWLVLDYAVALEAAGFDVHLAEFCERRLSPRNVLLSARRHTARAGLPVAA